MKRVNIRIPDDVAEKVALYADRFGITQSQLMGMAIQAGLDAIIRAISPVESITPAQWAAIMSAIESQKSELPNGK